MVFEWDISLSLQVLKMETSSLQLVEPKVVAAVGAFALWCAEVDGSELPWIQGLVVTAPQSAQECAARAAWFAFAAILGDGSVVTWGDARFGGDSSKVQAQLRNVKEVEATQSAFAAILADGSVVTWGDPTSGGDSSTVQDQLMNVQQIRATGYAFATQKDGSVVTWGDPDFCWGDPLVDALVSALETSNRFKMVQATSKAFVAILPNGYPVTWGDRAILSWVVVWL